MQPAQVSSAPLALLTAGETAIMYMSCTLDGGSNVVDRYVMIRALIARPGG